MILLTNATEESVIMMSLHARRFHHRPADRIRHWFAQVVGLDLRPLASALLPHRRWLQEGLEKT